MAPGWAFGPAKELSSDVEAAISISGIWVHPMKDQIPLMVPYSSVPLRESGRGRQQ